MKPSNKRGKPATGPESPGWAFGRILKATVGRLLLALFRVRCLGIENLPDGPFVLAGNHVSYLDPTLLWCCAPRPVHFMAKSELWDTRWLAWMLDEFWVFPVNRGTADREAIGTATRLLEAGDVVAIFPEGTRQRGSTGELGRRRGESRSSPRVRTSRWFRWVSRELTRHGLAGSDSLVWCA